MLLFNSFVLYYIVLYYIFLNCIALYIVSTYHFLYNSCNLDQTGIPDLWHFMYKSRSTAQFTSPEIGAPYITVEERERYACNHTLVFYTIPQHHISQHTAMPDNSLIFPYNSKQRS